jgi:hypothetical protein
MPLVQPLTFPGCDQYLRGKKTGEREPSPNYEKEKETGGNDQKRGVKLPLFSGH